MKVQRHHVVLAIHRGHQRAAQDAAQVHHVDEAVDQFGRRAEAVFHFVGQRVEVVAVRHVGQLLVEHQTLVDVGNVRLGQVGRHADVDFRFDGHLDGAAAQFVDGLFQHLGVEFVADRGHAPRLLLAQQVAGPADLQVVGRQPEAAAQVVQFLQDFQAPLGVARERAFVADQQIGVRAQRGATDPAAQLVELGQSEAVGAVDDDRVGGRNVEPRLDDGRT